MTTAKQPTPTNINLSPKAQQQQQVPQSPQNANAMSPTLPKVTLNDLSRELSTNLVTLEEKYKAYKQQAKGGAEFTKFFEFAEVKSLLYQIDRYLRSNSSSNASPHINKIRMREFCMVFLSKAFELNRELFQRKFEHVVHQMHQTKLREIEATIETKLGQLKAEIDMQMEKSAHKYHLQCEAYRFNKGNVSEAAPDVGNATQAPPKKQFDWSPKLRDMFLHIAHLKMNTFKSVHASPSSRNLNDSQQLETIRNAEKEKFAKEFFAAKVLPLWPEHWMQLNVLWSKYEVPNRARSQQAPNQNSNAGNPNRPRSSAPSPVIPANYTSNAATNERSQTSMHGSGNNAPQLAAKNVINISSKNGKPVRIEAQILSQTQSG